MSEVITQKQVEKALREGLAKGYFVTTWDGRWDITCKGARDNLTVEEHREMHRIKGTACEDPHLG